MGIQKEEGSVGGLVEWLTDMHTCERRADIELLDLGSEFAIHNHILTQHIHALNISRPMQHCGPLGTLNYEHEVWIGGEVRF